MKKIFTADLHIHEFSKDSQITESGITLKLEELLGAVKQMCEYAVLNDIKTVIFGGDLIHHNNVVYARPFAKF
jgi:DNA repair exonuclease SbcCD nuclease subunit